MLMLRDCTLIGSGKTFVKNRYRGCHLIVRASTTVQPQCHVDFRTLGLTQEADDVAVVGTCDLSPMFVSLNYRKEHFS